MKIYHSFLTYILFILFIIFISGCLWDDDSGSNAFYINYSTEKISDMIIKEGLYGDHLPQYDLSSDGRFVVYSADDNSDGIYDIFLYDSLNRQTQCITIGFDGNKANGSSVKPSTDADGSFIAFGSDADNLVPDDDNGLRDIFIYDRESENTTRIVIENASPKAGYVYAGLNDPAISANGRFIAFYSYFVREDCDNFDINNKCGSSYGNLTRYDLYTGEIKQKFIDGHGYYDPVLVEYLYLGNPNLSISEEGRYLIFETEGKLVIEDINKLRDIYSYDFQLEETIMTSVSSDGSVSKEYSDCYEGSGCVFATPCGNSTQPSISDDGQFIVFKSSALKLDKFNPKMVLYHCLEYNGIFIHERETGQTVRVSINNSGTPAKDDFNTSPNISPDGKYVIFYSSAKNLVNEPKTNLFLHNLETRITHNLVMDINGDNAILSNQAKVVLYKSFTGQLILGKVQSDQ